MRIPRIQGQGSRAATAVTRRIIAEQANNAVHVLDRCYLMVHFNKDSYETLKNRALCKCDVS